MNQSAAVITVVVISLALSSITVFAIQSPLRRLLESICPLGSTAEFWTRAAIVVCYLFPLWVVLVFGVPNLNYVAAISAGEIARRGMASASFALVAIVIATGLRLNAVRVAPAQK
jgi:hypothetical protein